MGTRLTTYVTIVHSQGVDIPNTGRLSYPITMVTPTLLLTAEGAGGAAVLHGVDKMTGERLGTVRDELPAPGQYGMMGLLCTRRSAVCAVRCRSQVREWGLFGGISANL